MVVAAAWLVIQYALILKSVTVQPFFGHFGMRRGAASEMENVFKLSQNRDEQSYLNIISKLQEIGGSSALMADELIKRKAALFPDGVEWDGSRFDS